ncbi:XrtA/PEP-CTERM system histidine kinase PrsK [Magnetospirillum molischianum]|uniref:histidine kinase n=1 Tax=Magnetospirillum molischianum DSM 120 TaxID=1150626 RepID=H8FQC2_MAGML|nr:XrtA/PEP-CTERM system histidine kinase PrsK [Magnetospirillum molischianum]CCG40560.1 Putative two-component sensor histidine kinase, classical system [Magnetospirillum molischianum DSM 120]
MNALVAITSYASCLVAFFGLTALVVTSRVGRHKRGLLLAAGLATLLWSGVMVLFLLNSFPNRPLISFEIARNLSWLLLLWSLLEDKNGRLFSLRRPVLIVATLLPLTGIGLAILLTPLSPAVITATQLALILTPVLGLLSVENLLRNATLSQRWEVKFLCLGLGMVFAYDFILYSDALLLQRMDKEFFIARGFVTALAVPPLAISFIRILRRSHNRDLDIHVSRHTVFHSLALLACGLYLVSMGTVAAGLRLMNEEWGSVLQITFMIGGLLLLGTLLGSGQARSRARLFINKNFYSHKYDYREEWLRFIRILSSHQKLSMGERIIRSIADILDSPAGALWVMREQDDCFVPDTAWNYHGERPCERRDASLPTFFASNGNIVDLDDVRAGGNLPPGLIVPDWILANAQAWVILPLIHRDVVLGMLILDRARAPRRLDTEDRDLIKAVASHAASALAEELASEALSNAQRLEEFNHRFAFVVHDIKNVVSQISLVVVNAERFGDRPDFQRDMMETVRNAVQRLQTLLAQLTQQNLEEQSPREDIDIAPLLRQVVSRWRGSKPDLAAEIPPGPLYAQGQADAVTSVLDHLLDNAIIAAGNNGTVSLEVQDGETHLIIKVEDNGPGMDSDFVRNELFRPLHSTKTFGYGLGAYQTRHLIRRMGGTLEVESLPGHGTRMRVWLRRGTMAASAGHPPEASDQKEARA